MVRPGNKDAAIVNSGMSRWHNYYVEGMNWLTQNVGVDGIYLDDVAFDRVTMKRIKRVLTQDGHPGIIDLHSANQYNKTMALTTVPIYTWSIFPTSTACGSANTSTMKITNPISSSQKSAAYPSDLWAKCWKAAATHGVVWSTA